MFCLFGLIACSDALVQQLNLHVTYYNDPRISNVFDSIFKY